MSAEQFQVFGRPLSCVEQTVIVSVNWVIAQGLPPNPLPLLPIIFGPSSTTGTQESWQLAFAPFVPDQEAFFRLKDRFPETEFVWTVERRKAPSEFKGFYVKLVPIAQRGSK